MYLHFLILIKIPLVGMHVCVCVCVLETTLYVGQTRVGGTSVEKKKEAFLGERH